MTIVLKIHPPRQLAALRLLLPDNKSLIAAAERGPAAIAALIGVPGADGAGTFAQASAAMQIKAGQAVRSSGGLMGLAQADTFNTAAVSGLATLDVESGFSCLFQRGLLTLADWTLATGAALLAPDSDYFLSPDTPGMLTLIPPAIQGQAVVLIGRALNANAMLISIDEPILL